MRVLCSVQNVGNSRKLAVQELYPLTRALEKTGSQGADLQDLQAAAELLKVSSPSPSVQRRSPVQPRSKPSKAPPHRRWQHE